MITLTDLGARANIKNAVEKLGVNLMNFRIKGRIHDLSFMEKALKTTSKYICRDNNQGLTPVVLSLALSPLEH
jgi:hypothetical protein